MTYDIVLPEPRTELGDWKRWKNNVTAQYIGESQFSRTIEVKQFHEVSPIIVKHAKISYVKVRVA